MTMSTYTHRKTVTGLTAAEVWNAWTDVNAWPQWQDDLESACMVGPMAVGKTFQLRPRGGPDVQVRLLKVEPGRNFTDLTRFPLAEMTASHEITERDGALELCVTIQITGLLAFLWTRLVVNGIVRGQEAQLQALVNRARQGHAVPEAA
jgi:hypothetical protein